MVPVDAVRPWVADKGWEIAARLDGSKLCIWTSLRAVQLSMRRFRGILFSANDFERRSCMIAER